MTLVDLLKNKMIGSMIGLILAGIFLIIVKPDYLQIPGFKLILFLIILGVCVNIILYFAFSRMKRKIKYIN